MFNVRLAGGHLYGKQLFTWLSLVVSLVASFCAVLFPLHVFDEIWDLIEPVSEGFLTYSFMAYLTDSNNWTWRLFCFGSLVVLDVVFRYLSLFLLYINIKIGLNRCLMLD